MCLIVFDFKNHPEYQLIIAANRDEFYGRKTAPADYWPNHSHIVGGRDLEAMHEDGTCGTWMGMTKSGRIAMITNYRDFQNLKTKAPSRGHLVSNFLIGKEEPLKYLKEIEPHKHEYNGFNLILGDTEQLYYISNYKDGIDNIQPEFYGLSNHLLETPWPKITLAKNQIKPLLAKEEIDPEDLMKIMQNEHRAQDKSLPNTGIGVERERALSSMFIKTEGYGTRCTTVVLVKKNGDVSFTERTYNPDDFSYNTRQFNFKIQN